MSFSTPYLDVRTTDGHEFELLVEHRYTARDDTVYVLPAGAKSDGASIPREFWNILAPFGRHWIPAYYHDHHYRDTEITKEQADLVFREMMIANGVPLITAETIYEAVRLAGQSAFNQDRAQLAAETK